MGNNPVIGFDMRGDTVLMQNLPNRDFNGGGKSEVKIVSSELLFSELYYREWGGADINWANQPAYIQRQYANYNEGYARQHAGVAERDNAFAMNMAFFVATDGIGEIVGPAIAGWLGRGGSKALEGVQLNKIAGDAFKDELADVLTAAGRTVTKEAYKWTPFRKKIY